MILGKCNSLTSIRPRSMEWVLINLLTTTAVNLLHQQFAIIHVEVCRVTWKVTLLVQYKKKQTSTSYLLGLCIVLVEQVLHSVPIVWVDGHQVLHLEEGRETRRCELPLVARRWLRRWRWAAGLTMRFWMNSCAPFMCPAMFWHSLFRSSAFSTCVKKVRTCRQGTAR